MNIPSSAYNDEVVVVGLIQFSPDMPMGTVRVLAICDINDLDMAVIVQTLIYGRIAFTRVLGIAHILWLPMFGWMALRLDSIAAVPALQTWLAVLLATNAVSLIIDTTDVVRFVKGQRTPHYSWRR